MRFSTLNEWLVWINSINRQEIELGLDRVKTVATRLNILKPSTPVVIVGGTNGKGSTVAGVESIYRAASYKTGAFTSPYLFKHNEQVRINGEQASDADYCESYEAIETCRLDVKLTPFEFNTLAALYIFKKNALDVWILEVGLGGRLDAVNIVDADVSVITSIGIDHVEWLGHTREKIGFEKAGIYRQGKYAICGDPHPPQSILDHVTAIQARYFQQGSDFDYLENENDWYWTCGDVRHQLPHNALLARNMANVVMITHLLKDRLPMDKSALVTGLKQVHLPGRMQIIKSDTLQIADVSHNPDSVKALAQKLRTEPCHGKTLAVFSMLADKDIAESIKQIKADISEWYVAPLQIPRAASEPDLNKHFQQCKIEPIHFFATVIEAYQAALSQATGNDRVVIFGSFHTVAEAFVNNQAALASF